MNDEFFRSSLFLGHGIDFRLVGYGKYEIIRSAFKDIPA
jgi:hypothetical protein